MRYAIGFAAGIVAAILLLGIVCGAIVAMKWIVAATGWPEDTVGGGLAFFLMAGVVGAAFAGAAAEPSREDWP